MARINSYTRDKSISGKDVLIGSSYEGEGQRGPIYKTKSYSIDDLTDYFGLVVSLDGTEFNINQISATVDENTLAIASAQTSITTIASDVLAQATYQTNLAATFGTFNDTGQLQSLSESFANQVLQTTTSEKYASAAYVTNLASEVGTFDDDGNLVSLSEAFANQVLQTETTSDFASATFLTNLASELGTFDENGNLVSLSTAFANNVLSTTTTEDFATAEDITTLESTIGNIPLVFRQDDTPSVNEPIGSLWFDTNDGNKRYILVDGTPPVWTELADGEFSQFKATAEEQLTTLATNDSATATKITNLNSVLQILDNDGNLQVATQADYFEDITTHVDANSAAASKIESLGSSFGSFDPVTNDFTLSTATMTSIVDALTLANYASTSRVDTIESEVSSIPLIFKQDEPPAIDEPIGSLWFDTNDNNKRYVLNSGTPNTWDVLEDGEFESFKSTVNESINTLTTDTSSTASKVTNLNSVLGILDENGDLQVASQADYFEDITTYVDANSATASSLETLTAEVLGPDGVSGLKATVTTNSSAIAEVDGRLEASYGIETDVNGNVASMKLLSTGDSSEIAFRSDTFKIYNGTSSESVFTLDGSQLKLNVPLNGVSGTFSGDLSAAGGTFSGDLSAAGGTFSGDLSAAGGTFSGNLSAAGGTFNGTLTVGSGDGEITISASGLSIGSGNFAIDASGNATFAGDISGSSGSFTGSLDVGTVVIDNGYMTMQSNSATLEGTIQFVDSGDVYSGSIYASNTANQRGVNMYSADKSVISATNGASIELNGDTFTADPGHVNIYSTNGTNINGGPTTVIDLKVVGDVLQPNSPFYNTNGYQVIPGGLIIQWVRVTASNNVSSTWPTAFPNGVLGAVVSTGNASSTYATENNAKTVSYTQTHYYVDMNETYNTTAFIIALGY